MGRFGAVMDRRFYLYHGQGRKQYFLLPKDWTPLHFVDPEDEEIIPSIQQMTYEALSSPIGAPPLQDLILKAKKIAIIVDDLTRPTPTPEILEILLPYLVDQGISRENITFIIALGTHERLKRESLEMKLGKEVLSTYRVVQHNAWQNDLVPIRIPQNGRVVKVNPEVTQADLKIGISSILPHPMAGYGGGPKILMPGVCNFDFIRDHHIKYVIHPRSVAGVTVGNPFHETCMEAAQAIGLDFSINCLYNQKGRVIRIIGGSLKIAFEEAVRLCFTRLGYRFKERVDVAITSTFPHTHGHQLFKGLNAPDIITKETGAILLLAPLSSPIPAEFLNSFNIIEEKSNHQAAEYVKNSLSKGEAFLPDKSIDFNMAMTTVFLRPKIRTILVSSVISKGEAKVMDLEYASSIEEGLELLKESYPRAKVAIFPSGGLVVPIPDWEDEGGFGSKGF